MHAKFEVFLNFKQLPGIENDQLKREIDHDNVTTVNSLLLWVLHQTGKLKVQMLRKIHMIKLF